MISVNYLLSNSIIILFIILFNYYFISQYPILPSLVVSVTASQQSGSGSNPTATNELFKINNLLFVINTLGFFTQLAIELLIFFKLYNQIRLMDRIIES